MVRSEALELDGASGGLRQAPQLNARSVRRREALYLKPSSTKPNRLKVWGDSLVNKLGSRSRKARKRHASKQRRQTLTSGPAALPSESLLALQDDTVLYVYDSPDHAAREIEALAAEETFRAIFDASARPYKIDWLVPNQTTRLTATNGEYRLVPVGESDPVAFLAAIRASSSIEPARYQEAVSELARRLTRRCS